MTAATTTTDGTTERIQEAILTTLADGDVHTWTEIRRHLPGTRWQQVLAAVALRDRGAVDSTKGHADDAETYMVLPLIAA